MEAEPGVWRVGTPEVFAAWRERRRANLLNTDGRVIVNEYDVANHVGWEQADTLDGRTAVMERPAPEKPEEPRKTAEALTRDFIDQMLWWAKHAPDTYMHRIRVMKEQGGLGHLTDEQAAEQVHLLCRKVAEADAKRGYETLGLSKAVRL